MAEKGSCGGSTLAHLSAYISFRTENKHNNAQRMEEKAWGLGKKSYICKQKQGAMAETRNRRLPVGIQSFEEIREGGYLYVD
ncbi:MAG: hypothetical protein ACLUNW_05995, partial [Prevotella sp.]